MPIFGIAGEKIYFCTLVFFTSETGKIFGICNNHIDSIAENRIIYIILNPHVVSPDCTLKN